MLRTVVATSIVLAACGRGCTPTEDTRIVPAGRGPAYTPVIANGLRAIASACKTTRIEHSEQLQCTSTKGLIDATVSGNHFVGLSIALRSMILPEAKGHYTYALKNIFDAPGLEQVIARMTKMQTGDTAELVLGSAKVALAAEGKSQIAPEYKISITWQ